MRRKHKPGKPVNLNLGRKTVIKPKSEIVIHAERERGKLRIRVEGEADIRHIPIDAHQAAE